MTNIEITTNSSDQAKQLKKVEKIFKTASSRALNRTDAFLKKQAKLEVMKTYKIKSTDITKTFKFKKAKPNDPQVKFTSVGQRIGLDKFKVNPSQPKPKNKKQIKIEMKKGKKQEISGAFVADISGNKVFKRKSGKRLPIKRLFGPAVPQVIKRDKIKQQLTDESVVFYNNRFAHELNYLISKNQT